jgi:hypothetical protein
MQRAHQIRYARSAPAISDTDVLPISFVSYDVVGRLPLSIQGDRSRYTTCSPFDGPDSKAGLEGVMMVYGTSRLVSKLRVPYCLHMLADRAVISLSFRCQVICHRSRPQLAGCGSL